MAECFDSTSATVAKPAELIGDQGKLVPAPPADRHAWLALLVILLAAAALRFHFRTVPLERDEGEYAYAGQLILQGVPPYVHMYNMKMPGIYLAYAGLMLVLGQSNVGIHLGLLLVNGASIVLVFLLGRRLVSGWAGVAAAAIYALFSMCAEVQGIFANAEHFLLVPALAGLLLLLNATARDAITAQNRTGVAPLQRTTGWLIVCAGLLLGLSFVIKQHGAFLIAWGGLYLLGATWRRLRNTKGAAETGQPPNSVSCSTAQLFHSLAQRGLLFAAGAVLPFALTCIIFLILDVTSSHGVFGQFWFWTFTYARYYVQQTSWAKGWSTLKDWSPFYLSSPSASLWGLAIVGLFTPLWNRRVRAGAPFLTGLLICTALAVCPGLYFRPHYFQLMLPAIALWAGAAAESIAALLTRPNAPRARIAATISLVVAATIYTLIASQGYFFSWSPSLIAHRVYFADPYPEAVNVAAYIRDNTAPGETIFVMGSEPEIYFYAHRRSATGFVYMYPLLEDHPYALEMQKQLIDEVQAAKPAMMVFVGVANSWNRKTSTQAPLFAWFAKYRRQYFQRVGLVDIETRALSEYYWGPDAMREVKDGDPYLVIYRWLPESSLPQ